MKNKVVKGLCYLVSVFIQLGLIIIIFVINHLTSTKAGVMRHVYTRRMEYEQGIYAPNHLIWQSILATILGVLFIILFLYSLKKRRNKFYKVQLILASIMSFFVLFVINSDFFMNMFSYPYFIMVFEIVLVIQMIVVIVLSFINGYE